MGCDIHGWVEVRQYGFSDYWSKALRIGTLAGRNYGMFGMLFGVRDYENFVPIAPDRGLPKNVSEEVKEEYEGWGSDAHSPSYITAQEIARIDWDAQTLEPSDRVSIYVVGEDTPFAFFEWSSALSDEEYDWINAGKDVIKDNRLYRKDRHYYRDALGGDWKLLFEIMSKMEEFYHLDEREEKPNNPNVDTSRVRMVVWFDN